MEQHKEQPQLRHELEVSTKGLLTANKADIDTIIKKVVYEVKEGNVDKIDAYIFAKNFERLGKGLVTELKPLAETVPIGSKGLTKHSATFTESMQGVSYDFSECGDKELEALLEKQAQLTLDIDARYAFLKTLIKPMELVDTESGETYTVHPPIKKGKLGISVKLK